MKARLFAPLAAMALTLGLLVPARAATPSSGTISPTNPSVNWDGKYYEARATVDPEACPDEADQQNTLCDHFYLTVNVPASYWTTHTGGAEVTITWPSADDDFDLYVYDKNETLVAYSASGGTTFEKVLVQDANSAQSPYEVRVNPWLVTESGYKGTAKFVSAAGGPTQNPTRTTGGIRFRPATVVDPQRTEGEPIGDGSDNGYWESGPWGTSTQQSFVHRSMDGGKQFNIVSFRGTRPDAEPGGGDTDIATDDQGNAYYVDLEALVNLGAAVSNDNGNTWKKNPAAVQQTVVDRQWFALNNGTTDGAADNTVFLAFRQVPLGSFIYSSPGSKGQTDAVGGLVYVDSSDQPGVPISTGAPCGDLHHDPVKGNLYYPCAKGDHVEITVGHLNSATQRTGIHYVNRQAPKSPGGGPVGDIFPKVATDAAGNLYAIWIDETDHNVYYAFSKDAAKTWSSVRQVNGNQANSNVFPWAHGGAAGRLYVAWYGTDSYKDSDALPSWYNQPQKADDHKWYGYMSLITGAAGSSPTFYQQRFTEKPMHYGQICNGGLGCSTTGGDRTMADFFHAGQSGDGGMNAVYNDTTSQYHGAHLFYTRQVKGPTVKGTNLSKSLGSNPMGDQTDDAHWPHYAPGSPNPGGKAGPNQPQLDFTKVAVGQPTADTLRVQMTVKNFSTNPPPGKTNAVWLTRFQALSRGDRGEEAFRIFYVGAESIGGAPPVYFAGSGSLANGIVPLGSCQETTSQNCKLVLYPRENKAQGSRSGNVITITVKLQGGFGANRPIRSTLYNVTAFSFGRNDVRDIYADVDATGPFDYRVR